MSAHSRNELYLRSFATYLGLEGTTSLQADPFARVCAYEQAYVVRQDVEEEVRRQVSQFILGATGSGKSSLFHILAQPMPQDSGEQRLVVPLSSAKARRFASIDRMKQGRESVLSFAPLAHAIFDAFWQDIVGNKRHLLLQFRRLSQSEPWSATFRQFYRRFRPDTTAIAYDRELVQWLEQTPHGEKAVTAQQPETTLNDLLQLILSSSHYVACAEASDDWYGPPRSYSVIEVLVDEPETFTERGFEKLLLDAKAVCTFYAGELILKLFLHWEPGLERGLASMQCINQGLAQVTQMPHWTEEELLDLLGKRVHVASGRKYESFQQLVLLLPGEAIQGSLRYSLEQLIAQGALQVYQRLPVTAHDAPIHVLKIAGQVIAAAAGCRPERYQPPLGPHDINELIAEYWDKAAV